MSQENSRSEKKKRTRRSAEKMAELVLEAERVGASAVCRRENIAPAQLSRWKQKFLQAGISGLKEIKRGPRPKEDPVIAEMKAETERLSQALLETSIELQAMKKKNRSV
jgi:signal transduction protein with GAF and PtsI domain